jgi:hypothetical protein
LPRSRIAVFSPTRREQKNKNNPHHKRLGSVKHTYRKKSPVIQINGNCVISQNKEGRRSKKGKKKENDLKKKGQSVSRAADVNTHSHTERKTPGKGGISCS